MRNDLISRQAAIEVLEEPCKVPDSWTDEYAVGERAQYEKDVKALNSLPSAERRGRWVYNANFAEPPFKCSACGKSQGRLSKYCPECGARMEEN